jgi:hypothetical protein
MGWCGVNLCGSRQGLVAGSCEQGNEVSGFVIGGGFVSLTERTVTFSRRTLLFLVTLLQLLQFSFLFLRLERVPFTG